MTVRHPLSRLLAATMISGAISGAAPAQLIAPPPGSPPIGSPLVGLPRGPIPSAVTVNMRDVDIAAVAEQISRLTGRTLILDPQVRGTVNVTSAEPLSADGVWQLFQSVLRVHGFAAVRSGRAWRIVPQAEAVREPGSTVASGQVVTRLIRLNNLSPEAAVRISRPLVAQFGTVDSLAQPPAIIVTDYADNIARIERIVGALDGGRGLASDTISLHLASAKDVGAAIRSLYGEGEGAPRVAVDERSNIVLVRGDARAIAEARRIAERMDRPGGSTPTTRVFRLKNADAESLTQVLGGLVGGQQQSANPVARTLQSAASSIGAGLTGASQTGSSVPNGSPLGALGSATGSSGSSLFGSSNGSSSSGFGSGTMSSNAGSGASGSQQAQSTGFTTPDLAVQSAPELNAIVVRGGPAAIAQIAALIEQLDVRRPQVMIEAAVVEVTADTAEALGVQFGLGKGLPGLNAVTSSFTNLGTGLRDVLSALNVPFATAANATGLSGGVAISDNFQLLVQALGTSTKANLLSTPSITTLDNQAAQIVVGQNVPFRTGDYSTLTSGTVGAYTQIQRQDIGLTLRIIPRVHEGDVVRLDVSQEVSSIADAVTGAADIVTNRRAIQTTVLADNAQTIVLGGLVTDDRGNSKSQVPGLGDIPVLGTLFKSRKLTQTRRTLFVFLRPTILRSPEQVAAAAAGKYDRLRGAEDMLNSNRSLLLDPPKARLTPEIAGIY